MTTDKILKVQSESKLQKYFYLWLLVGLTITLFAILGLHQIAVSIPQYEYSQVQKNVKFNGSWEGDIHICYIDPIDKGMSSQLNNMDRNSPTVKIPTELGYCDGYRTITIHSWWDVLR